VRRDAEHGTLALHRLVQAVQQKALPEQELRLWAERAVRLVSTAFPTAEAPTWERCQQLVPHALICAEHIEHWGFTFPEAASLMHQAGRYLHQRAAYEQALPLLLRALTMREQALEPTHLLVAQSLDALAALYWVKAQYAQALPLYQRALTIRREALGPNHLDVAESLNNLASLYHAQGQYDLALPIYQQTLAIVEQVLGPNHPT
jgi:tetratricopeptide (TPR) repeat protein